MYIKTIDKTPMQLLKCITFYGSPHFVALQPKTGSSIKFLAPGTFSVCQNMQAVAPCHLEL